MSDPQNLNQTSPGALSTGTPPKVELPLTPTPETPSTAASAPAPPSTSDGTFAPPPTTTANSEGGTPTVLGRAGSGAPAQPAGVGLQQGCTGVEGGGGGGGGSSLVSISISPTTTPLLAGGTQQYVATGHYSDGPPLDLTSAVVWASTDPTVATIVSGTVGGLATLIETGATQISATIGSITGVRNIAVVPSNVVSIPTFGSVGDEIILTGIGFARITDVQFNGTSVASFVVNSTTQITTHVPAGATSGPIAVVTTVGTVDTEPFEVINGFVADLSSSTLPASIVAARTGVTMYPARSTATAAKIDSGGVFEDYGLVEGGGWWTFPSFDNRITEPFDHTTGAAWNNFVGSLTVIPNTDSGPAVGGPTADTIVDTDPAAVSATAAQYADPAQSTIDSFWVKDAPAPNAPDGPGGLEVGNGSGGIGYPYPAGSASGWVRVSGKRPDNAILALGHIHRPSGYVPTSDSSGLTPVDEGGRQLWGDSNVLGYTDLPLGDGSGASGDCTLEVAGGSVASLVQGGDIDLLVRYLPDYLDDFLTKDGGYILSIATPDGLFGIRFEPAAFGGAFRMIARGVDNFLFVSFDSFPGGTPVQARLVYKPSTGVAALLISYGGAALVATGSASAGAIGAPTAAWLGSNLGASIMPRRFQRIQQASVDYRDFEGLILGDSISANYQEQYILPSSQIYTAAEARTRPGILSLAQPGNTIALQQAAYDTSFVKGRAALKWVVIQLAVNDIISGGASGADVQNLLNTLIADINTNNPGAQILLGQMTPLKDALTAPQYAAWLDANARISNPAQVVGSSIIARIVWTALNDGTNNLKAIYNIGDNTHPNNAGRTVMGQTWRAILVANGLL